MEDFYPYFAKGLVHMVNLTYILFQEPVPGLIPTTFGVFFLILFHSQVHMINLTCILFQEQETGLIWSSFGWFYPYFTLGLGGHGWFYIHFIPRANSWPNSKCIWLILSLLYSKVKCTWLIWPVFYSKDKCTWLISPVFYSKGMYLALLKIGQNVNVQN